MLYYLLRPLSWLPLRWLHGLGALVGRLVYRCSRSYARRIDDNLEQSGLARDPAEFQRLRRAVIAESGKTALEVLAVWTGSAARLMGRIRSVSHLDALDAARRAGRGVLLLTPHLGCFEIAGFYFGQIMPITVLYRPPRSAWLEPLMIRGRKRGQVELAPTDLAGVRRLLRALKRGEAVGMLPDQAPRFGEGAWVDFFGRPAYTMTLGTRLMRSTRCAAFMVFAERLPKGAGYNLHIEPLAASVAREADLNRAIEDVIRKRPEQYLWGYDRYKVPRGVDAPSAATPLNPRAAIEPEN